MANRLTFAGIFIAVACGALILRDLSRPLEPPPIPSLFRDQANISVGHKSAANNPSAAISAPPVHPSDVAPETRNEPARTDPTAKSANVSPGVENAGPGVEKVDQLIDERMRMFIRDKMDRRPNREPKQPRSSRVTSPAVPRAAPLAGPPTVFASNQTANDSVSGPPAGDSASEYDLGPSRAAEGSGSRFAPPPPSPYTTQASTADDAPADDRGARVAFGGGAVQITAPWEWRVYEVAEGREVRLVLTPQELKNHNSVVDGLWIVCHGMRSNIHVEELPALLNKRVNATNKGIVVAASPSQVQVGGIRGLRQEIANQNAVGFHVLLPTVWGVCEVHARTADPKVTKRLLESILKTIRFGDVRMNREVHNQKIAAAAELLGSWKAYRSRFRLNGEGRIEIEPEPSAVRALGESNDEQTRVLRGDFEARDDLIFVRWDDGSFLNFRWRIDGDSLLLTDHDGRISELRMLLE